MCKKVSNNASLEVIEKEFGATFRFPKLYKPRQVIDGAQESSLVAMLHSKNRTLEFAIWGLLPETFEDDWKHFQNVQSTLTTTPEKLRSSIFFKDCLEKKRCLIAVTGFFVYHLHNGVLYPYHVHESSNEPLSIAGVYTKLKDGFYTTSLLMVKENDVVAKVQNIHDTMPLIIPPALRDSWLDDNLSEDELHNLIDQEHDVKLRAYPVAREFFKNDITYNSILEPVAYEEIPSIVE